MPGFVELDERQEIFDVEADEDSILNPLDDEDDAGDAEVEPAAEAKVEDADGETEEDAGEPAPPPEAVTDNAAEARARILQRERDLERAENRRLAERMERLVAAIEARETEAEPEEELPDPELDPDGYTVKKVDKLERLLSEDREAAQQKAARDAELQEWRNAQGSLLQFRETFGAEKFDAAVGHLARAMVQEVSVSNPTLPQAEVVDQVTQATERMVQHWHRQGLNPGQMVVQLAQMRGAVLEAEKAASEEPAEAEKTEKDKPKPDPRQDLRRQRERQSRARSLSAVGGRSAKGGVTAKDIMAMGDEEFDALVESQGGAIPLLRSKGITELPGRG